MKKLTKLGQVTGIQGFIMAIVGIAVMLAIGLIVLGQLATEARTDNGIVCNSVNNTACNEAYNATTSIIAKLGTVPTWIGILITVALAFIVLGYFYTRN